MPTPASPSPSPLRRLLPALLIPLTAVTQGIPDFSSLRSNAPPPATMPLSPVLFPGLSPSNLADGAAQRSMLEQDGLFEAVDESLYTVGPGDAFIVGLGNKSPILPVGPEGTLVIENVGPVPVADKSLREARRAILAHAAKVYRGDRLYATLARAKRIQISITGAVVNPGLYVVGGTARLTEALSQASGFSPSANRRITVFTRRGDTLRYDIDRYVRENDLTQNPYLSAGDQVSAEEVDYRSPLVEIRENDQVTVVQLKEGQTARDLVSSYHRTRKPSNWDFIRVYRGGKIERTVSRQEATGFAPASGDVLELNAHKPLVFVTGAVSRPSALDFNVNFNALDYLSTAGILPLTGDFERLEVVDADGKRRWVDSSRDKIAPGDHILVPQSAESRIRDWIGVIVSVASIISSITLTVVTLGNQ